jgi:hypothetical protein
VQQKFLIFLLLRVRNAWHIIVVGDYACAIQSNGEIREINLGLVILQTKVMLPNNRVKRYWIQAYGNFGLGDGNDSRDLLARWMSIFPSLTLALSKSQS